MSQFKRELTVAWGDCDDAGIVFYPNFFYWFDTTYHAYVRTVGLDVRKIQARWEAVTPLVDVGATFRSPATYDDVLVITAQMADWDSRRFRLDYSVHCDDRLVATGFEQRAWAISDGAGGIKGAEIPDDFRSLFQTGSAS